MRFLVGIFICVLLLFSSAVSNAQLYTFKNFDHTDGLILSSVLSVNESNNGYLWFGTDGAGLMRFDGKKMDYLEEIQGRTNRHVNSIAFNEEGNVFFSTHYRGIFKLKYNRIDRIDSIQLNGQNRKILHFHDNFIAVQDGGIVIYKNENEVIQEQRIYPFDKSMHFYGSNIIDNAVFLFTSKGNFIIYDKQIIHLNEWLGTDENTTKNFTNVYKAGDSLVLINKDLTKEMTILMDDFRPKFFIRTKIEQKVLQDGEFIVYSDHRYDLSAYITNYGNLITKIDDKNNFSVLINNSVKKIQNPTGIHIDRNGDIWITTGQSGVFRVSLEPFTKLNFHPLYEDPFIRFIGRTPNYDIVLSNSEGNSHIGNKSSNFKEYEDLIINAMAEVDGRYLLATTKGIKLIKDTEILNRSQFSEYDNKRTSLIFNAFGSVWISEEGHGLTQHNLKTNKKRNIDNAPAYFYNALIPDDSSSILFGSNDGVFRYNTKDSSFTKLPSQVNGYSLGAYVGNSTKDIYGNCWFTLDEGLYCYKKDGSITAITAERFLPSTLLYTLNADDYGNLIVGTNKGITVIKVDEDGVPKSSNTYNNENGFNGYETHMRSSFKDENGNIFVGTLEGLFMIKPEFLQKKVKPIAPFISEIQNKETQYFSQDLKLGENPIFHVDNNNLSFEFTCINAKNDFIRYSYKLEGLDEDWSDWTFAQEAFYNNLSGGKYVFKVRATVDEEIISETSTFSFNVYIPFFRTKWFIILIIGLVIFANFFVLEKTKKFSRKNIILSRDIGANRRIAASILLFGTFANTAAHIFAPRIDDTIVLHDVSSILVGIFTFILFLLVSLSKQFVKKSNELLIIGFFTLLGFNFIGAFLSDIHPFYLMAILLIAFVAPFIFKGLKSAIAFGFIFILFGVAITFYLEAAIYNQYLFLIGICIAAFLAIFMTYLRNNSLEKLIFTSGVVNKGNVLVVAFDGNGKISYASENIEELLDLKKELNGTFITELNQYQPRFSEHEKFSNVDLKNEFQEGKIFVTPLFSKSGDIVYYQWSCKEFSDDVRVILGQDVTDKINLENYYELIVRNADDLIFQTDPQGNFTFVNEKCEEVFGRSKNDLIGKSITSVINKEYQSKVRAFYAQNFKEKRKNDYLEFPITTPEGEDRWLGQNLTTLLKPGADNIIVGFLGLARDITERREANAIIKEQNKDITSSINYARRIQFNMLPRSSDFEKTFNEHFIIFKPKDIVSGDFYWLNEVDNKTIIVCSDCTGHGVPGSFMTLLGINILNQIILEAKITNPGRIFDELDKRLIEVLPRDGQNRIKDGMEAVVCVFNHDDESVQYACAGGRFVVTDDENEDITVYKTDSKHIGDPAQTENFAYQTKEINLNQHQILYLFSDGYPDQFGGKRNKKLTIKKFLALLDALTHQDLQEQNEIFREHLAAWISSQPQTDDITLIALKGIKSRNKEKS
jgi:PAS domain S-box-containing protein